MRSVLRGNRRGRENAATTGADALREMLEQPAAGNDGATAGGGATDGMVAMLRQLAAVDPAVLQSVLTAAAQTGLRDRASTSTTTPPSRRGGVTVLTPEENNRALEEGLDLAGADILQNGGADDAEEDDAEGAALQRIALATLPPEPTAANSPTLAERLKAVAIEQAESDVLEEDLEKFQGQAQATEVARFIDHHTQVDEPMVLCAMAQDSRRVSLVHSIVKFYGGRKKEPDFDDKIMGALGERKANGADPPYVVLKQSAFEWKGVKLPADTSTDGPMWVWYGGESLDFFNPRDEHAGTTTTSVPNMGCLPAELAIKALKERMTPWELHAAILEYEESASDGVKVYLTHTKNWCIAASLRGASRQCSKLAVQMTPVYDAPRKVAKALEERLAETIGRAQRAPPRVSQPQAFPQVSQQEVARNAMQSMMRSAAPSVDAIGDSFTKGVELAMRTLSNNASEDTKKGFSDTQKGKIMGWCFAGSWREVPGIWHEIEQAKSDEDLRVVLSQHWKKNEGDLNVQFYSIYWAEEILLSLRKVTLTKGSRATWATSEKGVSMLLLMPRTDDARMEIEEEYQLRQSVGENLSMADLRRAERTPRLPPLRWEELATLLTTYGLFLEMLFGPKNAHLRGVNAVRRQLFAMADYRHLFSKAYIANVSWAILDDGVNHFNLWVPYDDIVGARTTTALEGLVWPSSKLEMYAASLSHLQFQGTSVTFPTQWTRAIEAGGGYETPEDATHRGRGGGGGGFGGGGGGQGGGQGAGGGRKEEKRKGAKKQEGGGARSGAKEWKELHADRYNVNGPSRNPHAPAQLQNAIAAVQGGNISFPQVLKGANTSHFALAKKFGGDEFRDGICPAYSCGVCVFKYCKSAHLYDDEMPRGYPMQLCTIIKTGVANALESEDELEQPAKRQCQRRG